MEENSIGRVKTLLAGLIISIVIVFFLKFCIRINVGYETSDNPTEIEVSRTEYECCGEHDEQFVFYIEGERHPYILNNSAKSKIIEISVHPEETPCVKAEIRNPKEQTSFRVSLLNSEEFLGLLENHADEIVCGTNNKRVFIF